MLTLLLTDREVEALESILVALEDGISNRLYEEAEWGEDVRVVRMALFAARAARDHSEMRTR